MTQFSTIEFFVFMAAALSIVSISYWLGKQKGVESGYRHGLLDGIREGRKGGS